MARHVGLLAYSTSPASCALVAFFSMGAADAWAEPPAEDANALCRERRRTQDGTGQAESVATAATVAFVSGGIVTAAGVTWGVVDLGPRGATLRGTF
jgi:hypothetical protein